MVSRSYTAEEVLAMLNVDVDSDDEDFEEVAMSLVEEYEDVEDEIQQSKIVFLTFANICLSNSFTGTTTSIDGTTWRADYRSSQTRARNIIRQRPGAKQFILNRVDTYSDIFFELLGQNTLDIIVEKTVQEAERQGNKDFLLSRQEMVAFLGLCLIRGVIKGRDEPLPSFWEENYGRAIFRQTMSRNKFQEIMRYIRFDSKNTRRERRETDRFAAIRDVWYTVMTNLQRCYYPHENVTVDEQLFPCRSRCGFIQYMPQKPGKFGIKFWMLCDAETSYVLFADPYVGRQERGELGLSEHVVTKLLEPYHNSGLNVTTDNFFTSLRLAKRLLDKNITLVGTVRSNRREIPPQIKMEIRNVPLYESQFAFTENEGIMMTSYKSKRNKIVYLLSSCHNSAVVDENSEKRCPEVVLYYNKTKGGVDNADEMLRGYSTKAASRRWPLAVFFNLLDIVALDAYVIAQDIGGSLQTARRKFLLQLGEVLCASEITRRSSLQQNLSLSATNSVSHSTLPNNKRTTCRICQSNKTRTLCCKCGKFVCGSCSKSVCSNCV